LLSKVFWYWNSIQLRVKENILWIKWITTSFVNRIRVKSLTYCPIIIRFASLCLNSGVYTLSHEIGLCCKICRRSDVALEFNWIWEVKIYCNKYLIKLKSGTIKTFILWINIMYCCPRLRQRAYLASRDYITFDLKLSFNVFGLRMCYMYVYKIRLVSFSCLGVSLYK